MNATIEHQLAIRREAIRIIEKALSDTWRLTYTQRAAVVMDRLSIAGLTVAETPKPPAMCDLCEGKLGNDCHSLPNGKTICDKCFEMI